MRPAAIRLVVAATIIAASFMVAPGVRADDAAVAEVLFQEGRALLREGKTAEAREKFEESQRLDPSSGTLINLAACEETEGRLASAWAHFVGAGRLARAEGKIERVEEAERRAKLLEARLPRVTIAAPLDTPGAVLHRDGQDLGTSVFDTEIPMDPGTRTIEVTAAGRVAFSTTIEAQEGQSVIVEVPRLAAIPEPPPPRPNAPSAPLPTAPAPLPSFDRLMVGGGLFGAGGATALVGGALGAAALAKNADSEALCAERVDCSEEALTAYDLADSLAWGANVMIPLGIVAAGTGLIMVLTAPDPDESRSVENIAVRLGPAGLEVGAAF